MLLLCVAGISAAHAQNFKIGVTGNIGLSKASTGGYYSLLGIEREFALSGNIGLFAEKKIGSKSSLGAELLWVQLEAKENIKTRDLVQYNGSDYETVGTYSSKWKTHLSYLAMPLYYRMNFGKFGIKGGVQSMLFLFGKMNLEHTGIRNDEPYHEELSFKNIDFRRFDFGPKIGIDYQLNSKFRLRADYYQGILDNTPHQNAGSSLKYKNVQLNVGLQYQFGGR